MNRSPTRATADTPTTATQPLSTLLDQGLRSFDGTRATAMEELNRVLGRCAGRDVVFSDIGQLDKALHRLNGLDRFGLDTTFDGKPASIVFETGNSVIVFVVRANDSGTELYRAPSKFPTLKVAESTPPEQALDPLRHPAADVLVPGAVEARLRGLSRDQVKALGVTRTSSEVLAAIPIVLVALGHYDRENHQESAMKAAQQLGGSRIATALEGVFASTARPSPTPTDEFALLASYPTKLAHGTALRSLRAMGLTRGKDPLLTIADGRKNFRFLQTVQTGSEFATVVRQVDQLDLVPQFLPSDAASIRIGVRGAGLRAGTIEGSDWPGMLAHSSAADRKFQLTVELVSPKRAEAIIELSRIPPAADCCTWSEVNRFAQRMARKVLSK